MTGSGVSAAPAGRNEGYGSGRDQSFGQTGSGRGPQAQGYAGGQGYTGSDNNRPTGQTDYSGTGANRGGPQTSQTGYGQGGYGQNTGVSGTGAEYRAGPTGGNVGGPQTDQSTYGTGRSNY